MSLARGRLKKAAEKSVQEYTASLPIDWCLSDYDIAGSLAHVKMLGKQGIISKKEADTIIAGLKSIAEEIHRDEFTLKPDMEDVHLAIETRLIEKIGKVGGKLHTARSRNDQVALDVRMFVKDIITASVVHIQGLQKALLDLAEANKDAVMPGYTHLQPAQPVLFAHHLLAYYEMLERDIERLQDSFLRVDVMPLGSGALAGVTYSIDREFVAQELGFSDISRNSMDAVSDRDYIIEFEAAASICMMHLSRLAEEIILWSSAEFGFIELDDAYTTGSSIMPQKKNPDVAELARGKTGRVYGHLMDMLTTMKALPLSYNRDMQEDKKGLFDTAQTLIPTLDVFSGMVKTIKVNKERMAQAVDRGYMLATDLADYLVKKGEAFRSAYEVVGKLVGYALENKKTFAELSLEEYRKFSPLFDQAIFRVTVASAVAARNVPGGTASEQVEKQLKDAREELESCMENKITPSA